MGNRTEPSRQSIQDDVVGNTFQNQQGNETSGSGLQQAEHLVHLMTSRKQTRMTGVRPSHSLPREIAENGPIFENILDAVVTKSLQELTLGRHTVCIEEPTEKWEEPQKQPQSEMENKKRKESGDHLREANVQGPGSNQARKASAAQCKQY